jgi:hypothetical protein
MIFKIIHNESCKETQIKIWFQQSIFQEKKNGEFLKYDLTTLLYDKLKCFVEE